MIMWAFTREGSDWKGGNFFVDTSTYFLYYPSMFLLSWSLMKLNSKIPKEIKPFP